MIVSLDAGKRSVWRRNLATKPATKPWRRNRGDENGDETLMGMFGKMLEESRTDTVALGLLPSALHSSSCIPLSFTRTRFVDKILPSTAKFSVGR
jgi:hypothetical protein